MAEPTAPMKVDSCKKRVTKTKTKKYVFLISNALYAHAIYKLAELLSEDACWVVVRDTSMISDYAFEK